MISDPVEFHDRTFLSHLNQLPWSEPLFTRRVEQTIVNGKHMAFCRVSNESRSVVSVCADTRVKNTRIGDGHAGNSIGDALMPACLSTHSFGSRLMVFALTSPACRDIQISEFHDVHQATQSLSVPAVNDDGGSGYDDKRRWWWRHVRPTIVPGISSHVDVDVWAVYDAWGH